MFGDARVVRKMAALGPRSRWLGAALLAAIALFLQMAQWRLDGGRAPFLVFGPALVFAAAAFGRAPALLIFVTGLLAGIWMFHPTLSLPGWEGTEGNAILAYAAVGALSLYLGGLGRTYAGRALQAERALSRHQLAQSEA